MKIDNKITEQPQRSHDWFMAGISDARLVLNGATGYDFQATLAIVRELGSENAVQLYKSGYLTISKETRS